MDGHDLDSVNNNMNNVRGEHHARIETAPAAIKQMLLAAVCKTGNSERYRDGNNRPLHTPTAKDPDMLEQLDGHTHTANGAVVP